MGRIDNDETKGLAVPFLILAHVRTGGTFCAHALSNHPQVYCDRGETLHHLSAWRQAGVPARKIMAAIWAMDGYHAAGFRAIYRQAFHPRVWPMIQAIGPRIIHLIRENVARQGVSYGYQQMVRQGRIPFHPVHSFAERIPEPVEVDPAELVAYAVKVRDEMQAGAARLAEYPGQVLQMTYEEMTGEHTASWMALGVGDRIADFLGVRHRVMGVDLRRDFPVPMALWFSNWRDVRRALKRAGFGGLDG